MSGGRFERLVEMAGSASLFRRHAWLYAALMGGLLVINVVLGGGWWSFWPMYVWGMLLAFHFFVHRSLNVDEAWIEERAGELQVKSYDFGHIKDIEMRIKRRDPSMRPADERDR